MCSKYKSYLVYTDATCRECGKETVTYGVGSGTSGMDTHTLCNDCLKFNYNEYILHERLGNIKVGQEELHRRKPINGPDN